MTDAQIKNGIESLVQIAKAQNASIPIWLGMELCRWIRPTETRYFRCYIGNQEVTMIVANIIGMKTSESKDLYGCIIQHGTGFDTALDIQQKLYHCANRVGLQMYIYQHNYVLVTHKGDRLVIGGKS